MNLYPMDVPATEDPAPFEPEEELDGEEELISPAEIVEISSLLNSQCIYSLGI